MAEPNPVAARFLACLAASRGETRPFRHWLLDGVLPDSALTAIDALPVAPPRIAETLGRRETHNSTRLFFGEAQIARFPVCAEIASALQSEAVTGASRRCAASRSAAPICASNIASTPTGSGWSRTPTSAPSCSPCWSTFPPNPARRPGAPTFSTRR
jgi:hypothetical protein